MTVRRLSLMLGLVLLCLTVDAMAEEQSLSGGVLKHRVGTLVVKAAPGAKATIEQLEHEFWFGTAISRRIFTGNVEPEDKQKYLSLLKANFNSAASPAANDKPQYEVMLPNGVKIEFVGLAHFTAKEEPWWSPDGSPLAEPPYKHADLEVEWPPEVGEDARLYQIAFRGSCDPVLGSVSFRINFIPEISHGRGGFGPRGCTPAVDFALVPIPKRQTTIDIEVSAAVADVQPDYYSKIMSKVTFRNVSLRPDRKTKVSIQVADLDQEEASLPSFEAATFGPDVECALGFYDSGKDCFIDFDTGRTFTAPADVRQELAVASPKGEAPSWRRMTGDLNKTPIFAEWLDRTGADMVMHSFVSVGTAERRLLYFFDALVVWPSNRYVAHAHKQNPATFAQSMARVEQRIKGLSLDIHRVRFMHAHTTQPSFLGFRTAGGAKGMLHVSPIDPLHKDASVLAYRLLRSGSGAPEPRNDHQENGLLDNRKKPT